MYLNCKTYYSFCYGTYSTKELVSAAVERGVTDLALTNINSTCDTWEFVKLCHQAGIKPIAGVEIRNDNQFLYLLVAANNEGLAWIHEFVSWHLQNKIAFPAPDKTGLFLKIQMTVLSFFNWARNNLLIYFQTKR